MLSKLLPNAIKILVAKTPQKRNSRYVMGLIPPSQYDVPIPKKFHLGYCMKEYWETIPLFFVTGFSFALVALYCIYAARNKVDVVYSARSRANISRTMDLRNPSVHKFIIINQRYEPWPEMQIVLDKVAAAEKRAIVRALSCSHA